MKNGTRLWIAIAGLALTLLLTSGKGFLWAGEQSQKVKDNKAQIERQTKTYGQMDMRQRTLENGAAVTRAELRNINKLLEKIDKKLDRK